MLRVVLSGCPFLGFRGKCDGHHAARGRFGGDFKRGDDRHMEPKMAYFILFLFVAYVAPVFFLKGIELYAANHSAEAASPSVEQEKPAEDSQKSLVNA